MICNKCSYDNPSDSCFCISCGNPIPDEAMCSGCGATLAADSQFCVQCGTATTTIASVVSTTPMQTPTLASSVPTNPSTKKWLIPSIIGAVLLVFFIVIVAASSDNGKYDEYINMVKNGYLGQFHDVTVGVMLDNSLWSDVKWDAGESKDGKVIVEASSTLKTEFDDEGIETIVQFICEDKSSFAVSRAKIMDVDAHNGDAASREMLAGLILTLYTRFYDSPAAVGLSDEVFAGDYMSDILVGASEKSATSSYMPQSSSDIDLQDNLNNDGIIYGTEGSLEECYFALKSAEIIGGETLVVWLDYTNQGSESQSFSTSIASEVYQGGISLEYSYMETPDDYSYRMIKDGATVPVLVCRQLMNKFDTITLELSQGEDFGSGKIVMDFDPSELMAPSRGMTYEVFEHVVATSSTEGVLRYMNKRAIEEDMDAQHVPTLYLYDTDEFIFYPYGTSGEAMIQGMWTPITESSFMCSPSETSYDKYEIWDIRLHGNDDISEFSIWFRGNSGENGIGNSLKHPSI